MTENNSSERHNYEEIVALNAKLTNGSECQTVNENDGFECQTNECGSEHLKIVNGGSKHQTVNDDSERQTD